jgi:UDP-N-acetylglucosamine--N-acetylmuramyl-(pentapeptide) pyrophosphoryl-undecaprenol N-acetylglucosamine transferase
MNNGTYRVILSGGGTGGHIFPAIAIANGIRAVLPTVDILFVGATGKMEMDKVPRAGFRIVGLPVTAFHRRLTARNLLFPFRLLASLVKAVRVVGKFRPHLVIGTGGFASGPVLRVAARRGIPTLIQEQNSYPGVTNRLLAHKAGRICVAYPGMEKYFPAGKIRITGNPVRTDLRLPEARLQEARSLFNIRGNRQAVLVFGGSQGARTLNNSLLSHLDTLSGAALDVLWQTGKDFYPVARAAVEECGALNIRVMEFIHEMDFAYAVSDLVVCRSGAITLSELALLGKPAILVPLPGAAENHQAKNARAYVEAGAAVLVADQDAPDRLVSTLLSLVSDPSALALMSARMLQFARPDALNDIVAEALRLMSMPETGDLNLKSEKTLTS